MSTFGDFPSDELRASARFQKQRKSQHVAMSNDAHLLTKEEKLLILAKRKNEMLNQKATALSKHGRKTSKGMKFNLNLDLSKVEHRQSAFSPGS